MTKIDCKLICHSRSTHLDQLYTGFSMLHDAKVINLTQEITTRQIRFRDPLQHLRDAGHAHLEVVVNGGTRLHFDTHDAKEIPIEELEGCDFYFKRSYSPSFIAQLPARHGSKLFPLGLNYHVLPDRASGPAWQRTLRIRASWRSRLAGTKQALDPYNLLGFQPRLKFLEALPDFKAPPRVLFLVACYDPYDEPDRSEEKIEERIQINATRAACIRALREALGPRFHGGFTPNAFARENYPGLIAEVRSDRQSYLRTLAQYPICVATMGLHQSNGWKLAEYVAHSKAIVTESLRHSVPGDFSHGRNYLEFKEPGQCAEAAIRLVEDAALRSELMANNAGYYRAFLRPDALIAHALLTAMDHQRHEGVHALRKQLELARPAALAQTG